MSIILLHHVDLPISLSLHCIHTSKVILNLQVCERVNSLSQKHTFMSSLLMFLHAAFGCVRIEKRSNMIKISPKSQKRLVAIPIKRWISVGIQSALFSTWLDGRQLLNWYSLVMSDIRGLNNPTGIPPNNLSCWSILPVKRNFLSLGRGDWILLHAKELREIWYGLFNYNANLLCVTEW